MSCLCCSSTEEEEESSGPESSGEETSVDYSGGDDEPSSSGGEEEGSSVSSPPAPPPSYPPDATELVLHVQTDLACAAATRALRQVRRLRRAPGHDARRFAPATKRSPFERLQVLAGAGFGQSVVVEPILGGDGSSAASLPAIFVANAVSCEPHGESNDVKLAVLLVTRAVARAVLRALRDEGAAAELARALHAPCNSTVAVALTPLAGERKC